MTRASSSSIGASPMRSRKASSNAEAIGAKAIFITLDTLVLGWRPRDMDLGFLPFLKAQGIAQYTSDPVFRAMLPAPPEENPMAAAVTFTQVFSDPSLDWARIAKIRSWTNLPVVLKGIMRADDAAKALSEGYDGIMVSNHGGRQVDGGIGALDALAAISAEVKGKFRSSSIAACAAAPIFSKPWRWARAVGIGRPYAYGLALGEEAGVKTVMEYLLAELDLTMALNGCRAG